MAVKVYENAGYNTLIGTFSTSQRFRKGDRCYNSISSISVPTNYNVKVWASKGNWSGTKVIKGNWTVFDPEDPFNDSIYRIQITKDAGSSDRRGGGGRPRTPSIGGDFEFVEEDDEGNKIYRALRYLCVKISTFDDDGYLTSSATVRINTGNTWLISRNQSFLLCN